MPRTPRSSKIPQWPIEAVEPFVGALSDLAAPASSARIAQQLGISPAGGKFRSKLGTIGYYGLTTRKGDLYVLTPRGEALLDADEDAAIKARREAVMSTPFGQVIRKFAGREPNETTIAARLEDDFGSLADSAPYQAATLVTAAVEARLISNGRFDAAAIESVPADLTPPAETNGAEPKQREAPQHTTPKDQRTEPRVQQKEKPKPSEVVVRPDAAVPFAQAVQVVVKVDASGWTPEQVAELVKSLRSEVEPTSS